MKKEEDFREMLKRVVNDVLRERFSTARLKLEVKDVDAGVFMSPTVANEVVKPATKDDLRFNTGMIVDMMVREVDMNLQNKIIVRLQIDERGDVHIRNHGVQEAEILEGDVVAGDLSAERKEILEKKSRETASAVRDAIKNMMREAQTAVSQGTS